MWLSAFGITENTCDTCHECFVLQRDRCIKYFDLLLRWVHDYVFIINIGGKTRKCM